MKVRKLSLRRARLQVSVSPTPAHGLDSPSEIMIGKLAGVPRQRIRTVVARLDGAVMRAVHGALLVVLGVA